MATEAITLFPEKYLAAINQLSLVLSPAPPRVGAGTHISPRAGASLQFRDFAPYTQGDDLRRIDWNVFARTRHLFIRRFDHPAAATVSIVVDDSASMRLGSPGKFPTAARLALAVATAAIAGHDPVQMVVGSASRSLVPATTDRRGLARFAAELATAYVRPPGTIGLGAMLTTALARISGRRRGALVVISDFFEDDGVDALTAALSRHEGPLLCLRVTESSDLTPELNSGDDLVDCETGKQFSLSNGSTLARYRAAYDQYMGAFDQQLLKRGSRQIMCEVADDPLRLLCSLAPTGIIRL